MIQEKKGLNNMWPFKKKEDVVGEQSLEYYRAKLINLEGQLLAFWRLHGMYKITDVEILNKVIQMSGEVKSLSYQLNNKEK